VECSSDALAYAAAAAAVVDAVSSHHVSVCDATAVQRTRVSTEAYTPRPLAMPVSPLLVLTACLVVCLFVCNVNHVNVNKTLHQTTAARRDWYQM